MSVLSPPSLLLIIGFLIGLGSAVGPPKQISPHQARQVAKVGQAKKKFLCPVSADPPPIFIQWLKDGEPVSDVWTRFRVNDKDGSLRIKDIELEDAGKYVCKATNGFGSIMVNYSLIVVDKESGMVKMDNSNLFEQDEGEDLTKEGGKMKTKPVLVGPHPENETVVQGGVASFQCKVKSAVQPHIQWLKRLDTQTGEILNNSAIIEVKGQKFSVLKTGEVWKDTDGFYLNKLILRNILPSDAGMYICLGANTMGYSFRSAFLTVSSEPVINNEREIKQYNIDNINSVQIPPPSSSSSSSDGGSSDSDTSNGSLPLMIAIPAGVAIVAVTIAIYILQRRRCFNAQTNSHRNTRFNPVPTQERENLPTPIHTNPHMLPSAPTSIRTGDKVSNNRTLDYYSDISSVSRCHHQQQHNNLQYGY